MILIGCLFYGPAMAKMPESIISEVESIFKKADDHDGLHVGSEDPDPSKWQSFVQLKQGGIPAERAPFFIQFGEYDYRGVTVYLDKQGARKTRRGKPYVYLKTGDVLGLVDVKWYGRKVYFKLLTPEVYIPETRVNDKRHSRVSVMMGFQFPKEWIKKGDPTPIMDAIAKWLVPTTSPEASNVDVPEIGLPEDSKSKIKKSVKQDAKDSQDQINTIQEKIQKAQKDIEDAQKELDKLSK